jgi:Na+/H+ antiporter NhaD/arsenite permease-like protein
MLTALIVVFILAYAAIALEHPLKINKSASALIGAGLLWTVYALATGDALRDGHSANRVLSHGRDDHCRSGRCTQRL